VKESTNRYELSARTSHCEDSWPAGLQVSPRRRLQSTSAPRNIVAVMNFFSGANDTGEQFFGGVLDTGDKILALAVAERFLEVGCSLISSLAPNLERCPQAHYYWL
jgi:hypothetical protein